MQYICRHFPNGQLKEEQWGYDTRGIAKKALSTEYIVRWHREDGPAHIMYNKRGDVTQSKWWIHGKIISYETLTKYFVDTLNPTIHELFLFKMSEV